ncbi:hypothetical protein D3C85_1623290 [compost metagenome]
MMKKAVKKAMPWTSFCESMPMYSSRGCSRWAKAGSPTQPRPREARVMPSWQADR